MNLFIYLYVYSKWLDNYNIFGGGLNFKCYL
jgi:hypothetical protein